MGPGTSGFPVRLSDWLLQSCQADCLASVVWLLCGQADCFQAVRLTALLLGDPMVSGSHYTHTRTWVLHLCDRPRDWLCQQASGPLQNNWRPRRDLLKSLKMLAEIVGAMIRVVVRLLSWMSPFQWLVEEPVRGDDPRESEVETYFDAPDMMQPGAPVRETTGMGGAPDLEAEVRRRVNTEINAQLRELQESILQEREIALRNTGVGIGNPLQSSTPAGQSGVNSRGDPSVDSPQVFSPISRGGGNSLMGLDNIPPAQNLFESQGQHQDSGSYMTAPSSTWKQDSSYQRFKCKPERYDGTGDWSDYLRHFQKVADWNGWNEVEKAAQLSMNLSGLARQAWADSFSDPGSEVTYGAVVSVLTKRFKPEGQGEAYKAEFRRRNRRTEETFLEFGYALRRLAIRAFPRIAHEAREDMVIDQFLLGLSDGDMRRHVSLAHPGSVDQAITLATEYETITHSMRAPVPQKPKVVAAVELTGEVKDNSHLTETNRLLTELVALMVDQSKTGLRSRPKPRNPGACWACGEVGHLQRACPKREVKSSQDGEKPKLN